MDFVHEAVSFIQAHRAWAGVIVGALAFGESMVLVGILLPGTAVLVIVGGLVGAGLIDPLPVLLGAAIGAVIGDAISFHLGVWLGSEAMQRWPLNRYRVAVERAGMLFRRFGMAAVFFGRFFGPVRAAVPTVAGMMSMNRVRFQVANIGSAIIWAPAILSPGWFVARSWRRLIRWSEADWFLPVVLTVVLISIAAGLAVRLYRRGPKRAAAGE